VPLTFHEIDQTRYWPRFPAFGVFPTAKFHPLAAGHTDWSMETYK